jgi:hypothetical protein
MYELYSAPPGIPSFRDGQDDDDESEAEGKSKGGGQCVCGRAKVGHQKRGEGRKRGRRMIVEVELRVLDAFDVSTIQGSRVEVRRHACPMSGWDWLSGRHIVSCRTPSLRPDIDDV